MHDHKRFTFRNWMVIAVCGLLVLVISSCGGSMKVNSCVAFAGINVSPATATANHLAPSPGNTQQFLAFPVAAPGCAVIQSNLTNAVWTVSDTVNVSISNVQGPTYGTATCKAATAGAITVTATVPNATGGNLTGTASLTCN